MAAVGRTYETQVVNDNIYDNNAKEITPEMVRAVMAVLIESHFNLVDDELMNLKYSSSLTLAQKFTQGGFLASGTIALGSTLLHSVGQTFSCTGDFATATLTAGNANDELITVTFNDNLANNNYMPIVAVKSNKINYDDDDDLIVSTFKAASVGSFQIAMKKITNDANVTLYVKIVGM